MDTTEPTLSDNVLAIADQILEEMRGGPLLAVSPERSRQILARWIVRLMTPDADEQAEADADRERAIRQAVLAERERIADLLSVSLSVDRAKLLEIFARK